MQSPSVRMREQLPVPPVPICTNPHKLRSTPEHAVSSHGHGTHTVGFMYTLHVRPSVRPSVRLHLYFPKGLHCSDEICYSKILFWSALCREQERTGQRSRYSDSLRVKRSGDRTPAGVRFSALFQGGPGAHPAPCAMGTGSHSRG
jgi:hypothetical protein